MLNLLIVIVVPYAFLCALLYAMPALSPRNQFFSVSVDPGFRQSVSTSKSPSYEMSPGAAGIVVIRLPMGLD